jgi:hypothetical protein
MILLGQNKQVIWNFDDISRLHVTGRGTGIQAIGRNGAGGELAQYRNREQASYVLEMLASAISADDRLFTFPSEQELLHAKQHTSTGGGSRHGSS